MNKIKKNRMQQKIFERSNDEAEYFEKVQNEKGTTFPQKINLS